MSEDIKKLKELMKSTKNANKVKDLYVKLSGKKYKSCFCSTGKIEKFYEIVNKWIENNESNMGNE